MKRLYKEACAVPAPAGFGVALDGKPLRTPAKHALVVPTTALAEAVAAEWAAQDTDIRPLTMPLTRLASTAIDLVAPRCEAVVDELTGYAGTDLLCYRAAEPEALVTRQRTLWDPLIDWANRRYDAAVLVTVGVIPTAQPERALSAFRAAASSYELFSLTALHALTAASGSLIVALAVLEGRLDGAGAWDAAELDETFQIDQWGEDAEATHRRAALRGDMDDACRFLELLRR